MQLWLSVIPRKAQNWRDFRKKARRRVRFLLHIRNIYSVHKSKSIVFGHWLVAILVKKPHKARDRRTWNIQKFRQVPWTYILVLKHRIWANLAVLDTLVVSSSPTLFLWSCEFFANFMILFAYCNCQPNSKVVLSHFMTLRVVHWNYHILWATILMKGITNAHFSKLLRYGWM
jgi:hypothetical protein